MRFFLSLGFVLTLTLQGVPATVSDKLEKAVMALLNQARIKRGLSPYQWNSVLGQAARMHSVDMARFNFFDHDSPVRGHREVNERVVACGGKDGDFGENLYWCRGLAESRVGASVMAEWLSSSEHRDTVLSTEYNQAGVGAFHRGQEFWITLVCEI